MKIDQSVVGSRSGRWLAIGPKFTTCNGRYSYILCVCDCGIEKLIRGDAFANGKSSSCGCYNNELASKLKRKHGRTDTDEFNIWKGMISRCSRSIRNYEHVSVCDRWSGEMGFVNFFEDMGLRPSKSHSIDRIDTNGIYEPSNCRWADNETQNNNTKRNVFVEFNGLRKTIGQWAKQFGVNYSTMWYRVKHKNFGVEVTE